MIQALHHFLLAGLAVLLTGAALPAQDADLETLQGRFAAERIALLREGPTLEQLQALGRRHAEELEQWLEAEPRGAEGVRGRLVLTGLWQGLSETERAKETLNAIDVEAATPMDLVTAAELASRLGMKAERRQWIQAAVDKPAEFDDRMTLARFLMTRLVEIEAGEAIFAAEMEAANDDEQRARVRYRRAEAIRAREDLPDGSYELALEELAEQYPKTYWGSVSADRLRALELKVGSEAIAIGGKTLDGKTFSLEDLRGKVVLLDFWTAASLRDPRPAAALIELRDKFGAQDLQIVGVNLDEDAELAKQAAAKLELDWPQLYDGRGWENDAALRYAVESVPHHLLIDRRGKIAALRIFLLDEYGVAELHGAIKQAVGEQD